MNARYFNHETTLHLLTTAAKRGNFISFIQVTRHYGIADQDWPRIYVLLYRHLDQLVGFCAENGIPPLSVLVVARGELKRGFMSARQVKRLGLAMNKCGYQDTLTHLRAIAIQNECFYWGRRTEMQARRQAVFLKPAMP